MHTCYNSTNNESKYTLKQRGEVFPPYNTPLQIFIPITLNYSYP